MPGMDTRARRIGLALAAAGLLSVVDTTVTIIAIPAIVTGLGSPLPTTQWVTTGYILGMVAVIPLAGWLANRYGDRRVYLLALTAFIGLSIGAGGAWSIGILIASRVLQGLAGGLLNPIGMAIALRSVPASSRGAVMGLLGLPVAIGPVLGPPLAGTLVDATSWRWIFWINLPLGLLTWTLCRRHLPESARTTARTRPDWLGLIQLVVGGVLLVLGCTLVGQAGRVGLASAGSIAAGAGLLVAFGVHALRISHPLLVVRLLRRREVASGAVVLLCFAAGYFSSLGILPMVVQGVRGDSVHVAGTLAVPTGLAVGITLQVATRLVDRVPAPPIILGGTLTALVGLVLMWFAVRVDSGYVVIALVGLVVGVGAGATLMPTMTAATRSLQGGDIPHGTTLLNLLSQLGSALGTAAVAAVLTLAVNTRVPRSDGRGGVEGMLGLGATARRLLRADLADAVATAYLVPITLVAAAAIAAAVGLRAPEGRTSAQPEAPGRPDVGAGSSAH